MFNADARRNIALRMRQMRLNHGPVGVTVAMATACGTSSGLEPILPAACGDTWDGTEATLPDAWVSFLGRAQIAKRLAQSWAMREGNTSRPAIDARTMGELVACWQARRVTTVAESDSCRAEVMQHLRNVPPTELMVQQYLSTAIRYVRAETSLILIPLAQVLEIIPAGLGVEHVTQQVIVAYKYNLHMFPWDHVTDSATVRALRSVLAGAQEVIPIPDDEPVLAATFAQGWATLLDSQVLAFYEGYAIANTNESTTILLASGFAMLTSLCKSENLTEAWVNKRVGMLKTSVPHLTLTTYLNAPTLTQFAKFYPREKMESVRIDSFLALIWSQADQFNINSFKWVVEQAAYRNTTSLCNLAEVVSRLTYFDIEAIIREGVPAGQATAVVKGAVAMIRNQFASIVNPPITIAEFPDLAYIAQQLRIVTLGDRSFVDYGARPETIAKKGVDDLKAIARSIQDQNAALVASESTVADVVARILTSQGRGAYAIKEHVYAQPAAAQAAIEGAAEITEEGREGIRMAKAGARTTWDRAARALPDSFGRLSSDEIKEVLLGSLSEKSRAFNEVLTALAGMLIQKPLQVIPDTCSNVPDMNRQISLQLKDACAKWGIVVEDAWTRPTAAFVPDRLNVDAGADAKYFRPPRTMPAAPAAPGGRGAGDNEAQNNNAAPA